jgi:hypothetical protein
VQGVGQTPGLKPVPTWCWVGHADFSATVECSVAGATSAPRACTRDAAGSITGADFASSAPVSSTSSARSPFLRDLMNRYSR